MELTTFNLLSKMNFSDYVWRCFFVSGKKGVVDTYTITYIEMGDLEELVTINLRNTEGIINKNGGLENFVPYAPNNPKNQMDYLLTEDALAKETFSALISKCAECHQSGLSQGIAYLICAYDKNNTNEDSNIDYSEPTLILLTIKNPVVNMQKKRFWCLEANRLAPVRQDIYAFSLAPDCLIHNNRISILNDKGKEFWGLEKIIHSMFKEKILLLYDIKCLSDIAPNDLYKKLNNRNYQHMVVNILQENFNQIKDLEGEQVSDWLYPAVLPINDHGNVELSSSADYKTFLGKLTNDIYKIGDQVYRATGKESVHNDRIV